AVWNVFVVTQVVAMGELDLASFQGIEEILYRLFFVAALRQFLEQEIDVLRECIVRSLREEFRKTRICVESKIENRAAAGIRRGQFRFEPNGWLVELLRREKNWLAAVET